MRPGERRQRVFDAAQWLGAQLTIDQEFQVACMDGHSCGYAVTTWDDMLELSRGVAVVSHDPGDSLEAYLVAMHELGHLATGFWGKRGWLQWNRWTVLESEARAWRWALQNADEEGPEVWKIVAQYMVTYAASRRPLKDSERFDQLLESAIRASI